MATPQEHWHDEWDYEDFCSCGALLDAYGNCPYCDYLPDVTDSEVAAGDDGSVTETCPRCGGKGTCACCANQEFWNWLPGLGEE